MIELQGVGQYYGARAVLRDVDLRVDAGEILVVLGPNGMGKTTLLRVMAGVLQPQVGQVLVDGVGRRSSVENELAIRQKVFFLPDDMWLPAQMSVIDWLYAVGKTWQVETPRLARHIELLLEMFDLQHQENANLKSLSTGQKKKVSLCAAMVSDCPILLLDEPFSGGLDSAGILALVHVLRQLRERQDRTVVLTTPVAELVDRVASRVAIVRDGTITALGTVDELRAGFGTDTTLNEVLEQLVRPGSVESIQKYLEWGGKS